MSLVLSRSRAWPAPTGERRTRRYRRLALGSFVAISMLLSMPGHWIEALQIWIHPWWPWPSSTLMSSNLPIDKFVHASLFAVCAALFVRGWTTFRERWWLACVVLILYGVVTELVQQVVPGRSATPGDLVADGVGVMIGVGAALLYLNGRRQ
ncbi:MAG: VanZ family protein [Gammaproteobacteria bacterium]|nr:VanZ family protein [Gammaproteobacteria bacterium]